MFIIESDNIEEFANNLFGNVDMVVEDERRWPFGNDLKSINEH